MEKKSKEYYKFNSLSELHRILGLPKPKHPLISLVKISNSHISLDEMPEAFMLNFYKITYQPHLKGKFKYGQQHCDFDEGGLFFVLPNQVTSDYEKNADYSGYTLLIHPDFLWSYPLATKINQYGFFSYSANEALHLSESEKNTFISIFNFIDEELSGRIDDFSQDVVIAQIELLFKYAQRFYKRQFITRKVVNNDLLEQLDDFLEDYFQSEKSLHLGVPTVQMLAEQLNITPSYLSDMLRSLTGQNAQQHIHLKLIEKAKEKLSTTSLTISEIAYKLGFEHSQSFNKLFKSKTKLTPLEFRKLFN